MSSPAFILVYGWDASLLETRRLVLEHAGFEVAVAVDRAHAEKMLSKRHPDLLLLCHSISTEECESIGKTARLLHPTMKHLIMSIVAGNKHVQSGDDLVNVFDGPRALVAAAERSLGRHGQASSPHPNQSAPDPSSAAPGPSAG